MKLIGSILLLTYSSILLFGQSEVLRKEHFNVKKGVALEGFDPVSYFTSEPMEGNSNMKYEYKNITYLFATRANLAKFKESPEKYEPAYGGWCAYAMGESGEKVKIDPATFKIVDGRLYLFYNFWGNNTLRDWNKSEKKLKEAADHNWKNIVR